MDPLEQQHWELFCSERPHSERGAVLSLLHSRRAFWDWGVRNLGEVMALCTQGERSEGASFSPSVSKWVFILKERIRQEQDKYLTFHHQMALCTRGEKRPPLPPPSPFHKDSSHQPTQPFYHYYLDYSQLWHIKCKAVPLLWWLVHLELIRGQVTCWGN